MSSVVEIQIVSEIRSKCLGGKSDSKCIFFTKQSEFWGHDQENQRTIEDQSVVQQCFSVLFNLETGI